MPPAFKARGLNHWTTREDPPPFFITFKMMYCDLGKDPDIGKDRGQKEKGVTEDEMVG